jgi:hypothetical protein
MEFTLNSRRNDNGGNSYSISNVTTSLGSMLDRISELSGSSRATIDKAFLLHIANAYRTNRNALTGAPTSVRCTVRDAGRLTKNIMCVVRAMNSRA